MLLARCGWGGDRVYGMLVQFNLQVRPSQGSKRNGSSERIERTEERRNELQNERKKMKNERMNKVANEQASDG